ncbi:MAG: hypothetical protein ACLP3C_27490 [Mycobacterium sp.]|uniref:hypothetical protein n=1 Tax=Mycobacterium sp. TaxID=1785 RepID=UPI003F9D167A
MTLRQLDVPASQWRLQDITAVRKVLADVGTDPALAQAWQGSVVLNFEEVPEGNPYLHPAIAGFLQNMYSEFPYLLYFLDPDRVSGVLEGFFASIGALCETEQGVWVIWSDDVATAFSHALAAAAEFAISQGDDWAAVVKGYEYHESQTRFSEIREILVTRGVIPA